ncbi:MAG: twin-arginine translocase subunit TatC, partial [Mycobacteriales bacterium]
ISKALKFLLNANSDVNIDLNLSGYFDFVTGMLFVFGIGFEFPLVVFMLNMVGLVSAKKLLGWWRIAVFLIFVFTAFATPSPDPFGMTALALPMCALYFAAVGAAAINDRRRAKKRAGDELAQLSDDEPSQLDVT